MDDLKSIEDPAPVDVTTLVSRIFIAILTLHWFQCSIVNL